MTFVKDTCNGFLKIYETDSLFGEVTNIGTNSEISIGDLADLIAKLMKKEITIKSSDERIRPIQSEVERLVCNNTKLQKYTKWNPDNTLEEGISKVIEWMKNPENLFIYKQGQYNF